MCVEDGCPRMAECPTLPLWRGLDRAIGDYLDGFTLADLLRGGGDAAAN